MHTADFGPTATFPLIQLSRGRIVSRNSALEYAASITDYFHPL